MKYRVSAANGYYNQDDITKMLDLGFVATLVEVEPKLYRLEGNDWVFELGRCPVIEIDSLEKLTEFIEKYGQVIIIPPDKDTPEWVLFIYDGMIE